MQEPAIKRAHVFVDGQNLYFAAKEAFGYAYPNYDIHKLANELCKLQNWNLSKIMFYTGVPEAADDPFWNSFWAAKFAAMGRQGITVFSRHLRYRNQTIKLPQGKTHTFLVGQEKGVDIRIALDVVRGAREGRFDVALVFSQDQDLSEVAEEIRQIAKERRRWIKMASAFPFSPASINKRGINGTDWVKIDRATYDGCIDLKDYRPAPNRK